MLRGWEGWWIGAQYNKTLGEFLWNSTKTIIPKNHENWAFRTDKYDDTCLWIMQPPRYYHYWGNYDCSTESGFICEINLPSFTITDK